MAIPTLLRDLVDFCYPPACAVCAAEAAKWPLCEACLENLRVLETQPYCCRCAMPLAEAGAPCPHCLGEGLHPFESVLRLCNFEDPVRHLVHGLKFHHAWPVGEFLADRLFDQPAVNDLLNRADLIVAVPLHPLRQVSRGYNQARVIAKRLSRRCSKSMSTPAVRLVHTDAQTDAQSRAQRLQNLHHAFGLLYPRQIAGKRIVVVDDVRTTAATLQSFGRCLHQANPEAIDAVIVAVADWRKANFERI